MALTCCSRGKPADGAISLRLGGIMQDVNANGATPTASQRQDGYEIRVEPTPRRVRVEFIGTWIADSTGVAGVHETPCAAMCYFGNEDVKGVYLEKTAYTPHCPFKGDASYWTLKVGDSVAESAAWSYE